MMFCLIYHCDLVVSLGPCALERMGEQARNSFLRHLKTHFMWLGERKRRKVLSSIAEVQNCNGVENC